MVMAGVAAFAALMGFLFRHYTFRNLDMEAMDCAQLARNIAAGRNFSTDFLRPFALPLTPGAARVPDLMNAPFFPFVLSLAFPFLGETDGTVSAVSVGIFVLCAALLFQLAHRLSGGDLLTASLTVAVFALSQPVLTVAISGNPLILSTCLAVAMLLALTPRELAAGASGAAGDSAPAATEPTARQLWRQYFLAGALASLCYLTQYISIFYTLPLALFWGFGTRRWSRRTALAFAIGFVLVALPWWIRNLRLTGNPFYSLQWLELSMRTVTYPGLSLLRDFEQGTTSSLSTLAPDLIKLLGKISQGLVILFYTAPSVPHLYLMPFIVVAYWLASPSRLFDHLKLGLLAALLAYVVALSALGRTSQFQLVPLAGLLTFLGVTTAQRLSFDWLARWREASFARDRAVGPARIFGMQALLVGGLATVFVMPVVWQLRAQARRPAATGAQQELISQVGKALPEKRTVATDVPWAVAWYAKRPALWLPNSTAQLPALEKARDISAIYLSPAILSYGREEQVDQWKAVYQQAADISGYTKIPQPGANAFLYIKPPSLAESQLRVKQKPNDAAAHLALGGAQLTAGQARQALVSFQKAQRLRPDAADAPLNMGMVYLRLKDYGRARAQFARALQLSPRLTTARLGLAEALRLLGQTNRAIESYEAVLADVPNQPIAIHNLAGLYAQAGNLTRALEMARRAASQQPNSGTARDALGWMCYRTGRYEEAVVRLQEAARLLPENGLVHFHLGKALLAAGKRAEAGEALIKATTLGLPPAEKRAAEATLATLAASRR